MDNRNITKELSSYNSKTETRFIRYMIMGALHSKNNAKHWFRYLGKIIDDYGSSFSKEEIDILCKDEHLTPFQKVSLQEAFVENSLTRLHIAKMNQKYIPTSIEERRAQIEKFTKSN